MIYMDSAATSFYRPPQVAEAAAEAIRTMGNGSRGTHPAALSGARMILETRQLLAELFGAEGPEQIAFTSNSTESLNTAIKGVLQPGDTAVTTVLEHNSVLRPLYEMQQLGVKLTIVGCEEKDRQLGRLDLHRLLETITEETRAVVVTHASNLTGNITDIRKIGRRCRETGTLFIVDASQTAGIFPIDMEKDCIDILCFTGHKGLMGPQGTGGICVRKGLAVRPLKSGGSGIQTFSKTHPSLMPAALEAGTLNSHGIAGLHASLLYLKEQGIDAIRRRDNDLLALFVKEAASIDGLRIYGDFAAGERAPVAALNFDGEDSGEVSDYLAEEYGICTRSGGHCAPLMHQALGTEKPGLVRFSFSHFNTEEQIYTAVQALKDYRSGL